MLLRGEHPFSHLLRVPSFCRNEGLFETYTDFVYEFSPFEVDQHGAWAWIAQALSALRRRATVFRVVTARTLFELRFGLHTQSR